MIGYKTCYNFYDRFFYTILFNVFTSEVPAANFSCPDKKAFSLSSLIRCKDKLLINKRND